MSRDQDDEIINGIALLCRHLAGRANTITKVVVVVVVAAVESNHQQDGRAPAPLRPLPWMKQIHLRDQGRNMSPSAASAKWQNQFALWFWRGSLSRACSWHDCLDRICTACTLASCERDAKPAGDGDRKWEHCLTISRGTKGITKAGRRADRALWC